MLRACTSGIPLVGTRQNEPMKIRGGRVTLMPEVNAPTGNYLFLHLKRYLKKKTKKKQKYSVLYFWVRLYISKC